ncbi:MAG: acyl-CoA dehydrogenase family protein [Actinomycetota bacterium]|nr:acyl-CoA dehydrogenase family protein [Actinomycetota bacterium]
MTTDTIDDTRTNDVESSDSVLDKIRAMAPAIAARGDEIEQGRRLPTDLVEKLSTAGCFRAMVPASHGGQGLTFAEQLLVIRELARADGSVGWTVMIGSSAPVVLGLLPRSSFDQIYAKGPDVILGGAFNPKGVATPVDGGYRVSGRWSFASGCQHCHWFVAHCMVDDGRMPPVRMMVLPPSDVEIADTWYVSGLCGTGSHDFVVDDVFVPDERSFTLWDEPALDGPLWRIPELSLSSLMMANVAVGIAEGALGEITTLASGKVPMLADSTLGANALFQHDLAEADARLRAARALLDADAATAWRIADAGRELSPEDRARTRSTAVWVARTAACVVDAAYHAGGGTSLYVSSPLQRRLRDVHAVTQHFALKPDTLTLAGSVLAGQDGVDLSFL